MRLRLFSLVVLTIAALAASEAHAQAIRLEADQTPLAEVLQDLAAQARIDIAFAERVVAGVVVTGRYLGDDPEGALRTVLRDSGLRAEPVRPGQYVIVPETSSSGDVAEAPPSRGILAGIVVDAETGEALPGANVLLVGLGVGAATNAAGYFALPGLPAGIYRVRVSFIGYRTLEQEVEVNGAAAPAALRLQPQSLTGGTVVVEGDGGRSDLEPVPGMDELGVRSAASVPAFLGENDLFGALEWLPGVARTGEAGGELVVRGTDTHFNRYLLDGAPVVHPWHTFGIFSAFQTEALKSVRLHKGSLPAEYGGGLSAVLDLEMKDGEGDEVSGVVALSPVALRGVAEVPLGRGASLMLAGRRTYLDLLFSPRLRAGTGPILFAGGESELGAQQDLGYYFYDVNAKLTLRPAPGHRFSLSIYDGSDDLSADVPFSSLFDPLASDPSNPLGLALHYGWGNRVVSARYRYLHGREVFLTATAYHSRYGANEISSARPIATTAVDTDYRVRFTESGLRLDADYYYSLEHQLRAGIRLVGRDFTSLLEETVQRAPGEHEVRFQRDAVRALEGDFYVQDTWQPSPDWQLQPGLRVEFFGLGPYLNVSPRLFLRHVLARERLFLRAGLSRQTQYLHRLRDRYAFTYDLASSRWIPASSDVRPAVAWQAAVGLEAALAPWLSVGADLYGRQLFDVLLPADPFQVKDGIEGPGIEPGALLAQYVPGAARSFGLELAARAERGRWQIGLSYALSRTQERGPGEAYRPARYDAPHALEVLLQGGGRRWSIALATTVRSGYPLTVPTARYVLGDPLDEAPTPYLYRPALNNGRLPIYARLDLAVGYVFRLFSLHWNAEVQAYNLLNHRNTVGRRFSPEMDGVTATDVRGYPLVPMFNLKVQW